ncbi:subunit of tubulin prefoldin [Saccharomyces pastorianus]|uniref:Subunit of tubulin prefoldin n=2 Tax=Saccharomyces TaxID=4930 RepID=A0A6C1DXE9_SACPS|nr:subunit of tubulin prefoldin [Saccharomyces pastorianus]
MSSQKNTLLTFKLLHVRNLVDLTKLNPEQLNAVKQQFDQELQHFTQSLQALTMAKGKFTECIDDIKTVSQAGNEGQKLLVPASASLYIPGKIVDNKKFMVDIGTGYYVEKSAEAAIAFYQKKVDKLNKESVQIQDIIKEKTQYSLSIEAQIRQAAIRQHEAMSKQQQQQQKKESSTA